MREFVKKLELVSVVARVDQDLENNKGLFAPATFILYRRSTEDIRIGEFILSPFPGNCGIVVCTGKRLTQMTQHSGLSDAIRQLTSEIAKTLGYTVMIATTLTNNIPACGNFLKSKYQIPFSFRNKRTDHDTWFGYKIL